MQVLRTITMLAACLNFTFSSVCIPTKENALADAASRFQYNKLFQLAPDLPCKPSSRKSHLIGMKRMLTSRLEQPSTCGMGWPLAPERPIQLDRSRISTSAISTLVCSASQAAISLPQIRPLLSGCVHSAIRPSSPNLLKATSMCRQWASHSLSIRFLCQLLDARESESK